MTPQWPAFCITRVSATTAFTGRCPTAKKPMESDKWDLDDCPFGRASWECFHSSRPPPVVLATCSIWPPSQSPPLFNNTRPAMSNPSSSTDILFWLINMSKAMLMLNWHPTKTSTTMHKIKMLWLCHYTFHCNMLDTQQPQVKYELWTMNLYLGHQ